MTSEPPDGKMLMHPWDKITALLWARAGVLIFYRTANLLSSFVLRKETDLWTVPDRSLHGRFETRTEFRTIDNLKTNYFLWM